MKLSASQIQTILAKTGARPIPADNLVLKQFVDAFGEHTFYVDPAGLVIWEPVPAPPNAAALTVRAVLVAAWSDERSRLVPHAPTPGAALVALA